MDTAEAARPTPWRIGNHPQRKPSTSRAKTGSAVRVCHSVPGLHDFRHGATTPATIRPKWGLKCRLLHIDPTQRYMPVQVLIPDCAALGRRPKLQLPRRFQHHWASSPNTRSSSARPPQQPSSLRSRVSSRVRMLRPSVRTRPPKVLRPWGKARGSPRWRGWSHPRVTGARGAGTIPPIWTANSSQMPAWTARCTGCDRTALIMSRDPSRDT